MRFFLVYFVDANPSFEWRKSATLSIMGTNRHQQFGVKIHTLYIESRNSEVIQLRYLTTPSVVKHLEVNYNIWLLPTRENRMPCNGSKMQLFKNVFFECYAAMLSTIELVSMHCDLIRDSNENTGIT